MSEYINIHGQQIEKRSSDPANPTLGQIWYNTTSRELKGYQFFQGWASGGNLATARSGLRGAGTQTAALAFNATATEEYDGSAWTSGGSMGNAEGGLAGAGTQTAALAFGGRQTDVVASPATVTISIIYKQTTEEYNGSTWTAGGNLGTARGSLAGAGTQTAGLAFGGITGNYSYPVATPNPNAHSATSATEEYNGSAWTSGGNLGTARYNLAGAGTQTVGLAFGGTGPTAATEEYNGSTWTAGGSLNTARNFLAGAGTQTAGLAFGGSSLAATEKYDGTSWTTVGSLNIGRYDLGGAGTQTAALAFGGNDGALSLAATEEYIQDNATTIFTTS